MRRLLFLLSCATFVWILLGAHDTGPPAPRAGDDAADVETMVHRNEVVGAEFTAAFVRVRTRMQRANHLLDRARTR